MRNGHDPAPRSPRCCIGWVVVALGLALLFAALGALAFGFYCWRVMRSDAIAGLRHGGAIYPCIGSRLDDQRPRFVPELQLARYYLTDPRRENRIGLGWHFEFAFTTWAIDAATTRTETNRMYASLPQGRFRSFDHVARSHAGIGYCELDRRRKQAVADFYWSPGRFPIEPAMRAGVPNQPPSAPVR